MIWVALSSRWMRMWIWRRRKEGAVVVVVLALLLFVGVLDLVVAGESER